MNALNQKQYNVLMGEISSPNWDPKSYREHCFLLDCTAYRISIITVPTLYQRNHCIDVDFPHRTTCVGYSTYNRYFFSKCTVEKPHQNYQDQPHQTMRGTIHIYSMWKIRKSQCMWKVHIISTFFSESVALFLEWMMIVNWADIHSRLLHFHSSLLYWKPYSAFPF